MNMMCLYIDLTINFVGFLQDVSENFGLIPVAKIKTERDESSKLDSAPQPLPPGEDR